MKERAFAIERRFRYPGRKRLPDKQFAEQVLWRGNKKRKGDLRGTRSETVGYLDQNNRRVARVHQNVNVRTGHIRGVGPRQ